ncbi:MAG: T9SS type A sorting domain-containing protein [Melioribacteraceae bacterium]|nr:T9SS type A sorting domain-containing protein [Melioribacteraceae bacterium]
MQKNYCLLIILFFSNVIFSQAILEADGPGDTYELISSVLAPGFNPVEHPECVHPQFGRHITEVWDEDLSQFVFEFYSHVTPDNDRCIKFDRQRVEIKTYDKSPDSLLGVVGETITYKWKFRLETGYQPSTSFTHIHQIKAVGGDDSMPLITLTPRKSSPNRMELIHNNTTKVVTAPLSLFEGNWVECTEKILVHPTDGTYSMTIKNIKDGSTILTYSNSKIMTIRQSNDFIRPKWGIYRSLNHPDHLRDEAVKFAGFSIQEGVTTGIEIQEPSLPENLLLLQNYPNPFNPITNITFISKHSGTTNLKVFDMLGNEVETLFEGFVRANSELKFQFDGGNKSSGVYLLKLNFNGLGYTRKMVLIK